MRTQCFFWQHVVVCKSACIYSVTLLRHVRKDYHGYGWPAGDFNDTLQGRIRVILCLPFPFLSMPSCVGGALG